MCLEDLHTSRQSIIFLDCNHNMHKNCLDKYFLTSINCPMCRKSLVEPSQLESYFDEQFSGTIMPEEYKDAKVKIHCNDCSKKSVVPFHVLGGKCQHCRSYNTMRDKGDIFYEQRQVTSSVAQPDTTTIQE